MPVCNAFSTVMNKRFHEGAGDEQGRIPTAARPGGPTLSPEHQSRLWLESPCEFLQTCQREYGNLFVLRLGGFGKVLIVAEPNAVKQVFETPAESYECRQFNDSYRYVMGSHALFLQDGESHRRLKRILAPQLRGNKFRSHTAEICRVTLEAVQSWCQGAVVRPRPLVHEITLRCLLKLIFGDHQQAGEQILSWFRATVWRDLRAWKPWTQISRLHPEMRGLIATELERRRVGGCSDRDPDLLDMLLCARDESGSALRDDEIQDQVLMLMITAGDAAAVAAAWALYRVAKHPEVQDGLRDERSALGADPDPSLLAEQPLLVAACQEILRLHTVLPTVSGRRLVEPRDLVGYRADAGVMLAPCQYLVHRQASIFEQPLAFRPERFLGRSYSPCEYFPFGGGPRSCLGWSLAPLTMKLVLTSVLSRFRLASPTPDPPRVVRYGTLLAPAEDLAFVASPLT